MRLYYGDSKQIDWKNRSRCSRASLAKFKANEVGLMRATNRLGRSLVHLEHLMTASFALLLALDHLDLIRHKVVALAFVTRPIGGDLHGEFTFEDVAVDDPP